MLKSHYLFGIGILFLIQCSSPKEKKLELDPSYQRFENLISLANCTGPKAKYTTEVHSTRDHYTYFKQDFGAQSGVFEAIILNGNEGFILDESGQKKDTLNRESIEIIKSHEFHKIHMFPDVYFENLAYKKNESYLSQDCERYEGTDLLNNEMSLYYNRSEKSIIGIRTTNPADTTEHIEIKYLEWMENEFGKMVKKLEIVQGGRDVYQFDFEYVLVNDSTFKKK